MKRAAGFLKVWSWMVILSASSDARPATNRHRAAAAAAACHLEKLARLTLSELNTSLERFVKFNGQDLGTLQQGFPEMEVPADSLLDPPAAQCSLLFLAEGLRTILEDQRSDLNPSAFSLQEALNVTIKRVGMLAGCVRHTYQKGCADPPAAPTMPKDHLFERLRWSHSLLKAAGTYLDWLEHRFVAVDASKAAAAKRNRKVHAATTQRYLPAGGHLL